MLVALWETSARLKSSSVSKNLESARWFLRYLLDDISAVAAAHAPAKTQDITFQTVRDFERWMRARERKIISVLDERAQQLEERLRSPLIAGKEGKVSLAALGAEMDWPTGYIHQHKQLVNMVSVAAAEMGSSIRLPGDQPAVQRVAKKGPIGSKRVEVTYYAVAKLLRRMQDGGCVFSPGFVVPELTALQPDGPVKTPALDGRERKLLRKACFTAVRSVRTRLLVDGPAKAQSGVSQPGQDLRAWAAETNNLLAYLSTQWPGQVPHRSNRLWDAIYNALPTHGGDHHPHALALQLCPGGLDLVPFIVLIGMNRHAPLNLSSVLDLSWCPETPDQHCLQWSPTPKHARIMFDKPRAASDRELIDVPDRGDLDIPGLLRMVAAITAPLRERLPKADRNALWLYLGLKGEIHRIDGPTLGRYFRQFLDRHELAATDARNGIFYRRLRPTAISEVAMASGIGVAQNAASHSQPAQTIAYALNPTSHVRLAAEVASAQSKALTSLLDGYGGRPDEQEIARVAAELNLPTGAALEIVLGKRDKLFNACVDDRNGAGPEPAGRRCGRFEACLVCSNSIIVERHLPRLIAYQEHWISMTEMMSADAWNDAHALNCAIVDEHLTKFPAKVVSAARATVAASSTPIPYRRFMQS
ncbi:hypothetical protein LQ953_09275 [Sphingomonas sp. IC-56]|uniref:hypothetical protein n=1 Tax=Sphingomonas sp. IC-56 TaxID=2898529 RepID=UPI001E300A1C|nr:hypothetical protein [Sphingomonas sp. IC-56]MCD2324201.1 hypothetical protein [Sphingomonas sp. IC-56]